MPLIHKFMCGRQRCTAGTASGDAVVCSGCTGLDCAALVCPDGAPANGSFHETFRDQVSPEIFGVKLYQTLQGRTSVGNMLSPRSMRIRASPPSVHDRAGHSLSHRLHSWTFHSPLLSSLMLTAARRSFRAPVMCGCRQHGGCSIICASANEVVIQSLRMNHARYRRTLTLCGSWHHNVAEHWAGTPCSGRLWHGRLSHPSRCQQSYWHSRTC